MFGYCGVTDDKIHFGVPVSNQQNKFSLRLIKMQCCVCVWGGMGWGGGGGGGRDRDLACSPQIVRAQIPNPVPVGQCHLIHLTILFSMYVHK